MALEAGNAVEGTGLAGAIARAYKSGYPLYNPGLDKAVNPLAKAIIDYLVENIEVSVDTGTGKGKVANTLVSEEKGELRLSSEDVSVDTGTGTGKVK